MVCHSALNNNLKINKKNVNEILGKKINCRLDFFVFVLFLGLLQNSDKTEAIVLSPENLCVYGMVRLALPSPR